MKANELMIGDWVWYDNQPYQIRQLGIFGENRDGDDYPAVCVGKPNGIGLILERNEISPILLTPEILKKNGFNVVDENELRVEYAWHDNNSYTSISVTFYKTPIYGVNVLFRCERNFSGGCDKIHNCHIDFVHELQHVLHLCGIEKEIKL